jgi:hypothetical protein
VSTQRAEVKNEMVVFVLKQSGRESFLIARHDEMPARPVSRRAAMTSLASRPETDEIVATHFRTPALR